MVKKTHITAEKSVDSGYAWVVLAACFVLYMISMGCVKSFGILYGELQEVYGSGSGNTVSIWSTATFLQAILSPMANGLSTQTSFRKVTFTGGVFIGLAFFLSSFVRDLWMMSITYSIIGGIGLGLTFTPTSTIVNFYFEKRRSFAIGVVVSASGVGGFTLPYLYRYLFDEYGLRGGLLVLSGFMLNACVVASLIRQPLRIVSNTEIDIIIEEKTQSIKEYNSQQISVIIPSQEKEEKCESLILSCRKLFSYVFSFEWRLLQNIRFVLFIVAFSFSMLSYGSVFYMLPAEMTGSGFGKQDVVFTLSILGICELFGRIILGIIIDFKIIQPQIIFSLSMFISGIAMMTVSKMILFWHFCAFAVVMGIFPGTMYTVLPVILIEEVGLDKLPSAVGLTFFFAAIVNVGGHPVLGCLADMTASWDISIYVVGSLLITSSIIVLANKTTARLTNKKGKRKAISSEDVRSVEEKETMLTRDVS